ncbi:MAG: phosphatase PAP2 family protein [Burkholderiales bacterium]
MRPHQPTADVSRRTISWLARGAVVATGLFAFVAFNVVTNGWLVALDVRITDWLHTHAPPALTSFMLVVTNAHEMLAISIYTAALALLLAWQREWRWLWAVLLIVPGGLLVNWLLKQAFHRARPELDHPLLTLETYSFPSAHTAGATLFYGVLAAYLIARSDGAAAKAGYALTAACLIVMVGFSRVYLGVHFTSDVIGAACASAAWMAFCLACVHAYAQRAGAR